MTTEAHRPTDDRGRPVRRRILLVDDHAEGRKAVALYLGLMGVEVVEVVEAGDGREALAALASDPWFDVILIDLSLPDIDGRELASRVRPLAPAAMIAMMTGWPLDGDDLSPWGIDRVFQKPVDLGSLRSAIDAARPA